MSEYIYALNFLLMVILLMVVSRNNNYLLYYSAGYYKLNCQAQSVQDIYNTCTVYTIALLQ